MLQSALYKLDKLQHHLADKLSVRQYNEARPLLASVRDVLEQATKRASPLNLSTQKVLELAAKACGKDLKGWHFDGQLFWRRPDPALNTVEHWSPLEDDGDALRLATDAGLANKPEFWLRLGEALSGFHENLFHAQVRRAIVAEVVNDQLHREQSPDLAEAA